MTCPSYQSLASPNENDLGGADHVARPIRDEELRAAINALKQSTTAIEKHTKSLEAQRRALLELKAQREGEDASTLALEPKEDESQLRLRESSQLTFAVSLHNSHNNMPLWADRAQIEDLQRSNYEQLQQFQDQSNRAVDALLSTTTERLERHDQVLEALAKLAPKFQPNQETGQYDAKTIDQWCHALAVLREKAIKAHIDTVMLRELVNHSTSMSNGESNALLDGDREELQAELKSLHDEILSVAKMVVGNDFREPILRSLQTSTDFATQKQAEWLEYVLLTQEHLIAHLQFFYEQCLQLRSYSFAVDEIVTCFNASIRGDLKEKVPNRDAMSPTTPRSDSASKLKSPTERSSTSGIELALRRFNIGSDARDGLQTFTEASTQIRNKLLLQYASSIQSDLKFLAQASAVRDRELQSVLSKLYASSSYGSVRLTDKSLDSRLQELDEKIADTAKDYAKVDSARKHDQLPSVLNKLQKWM